MEIERRAARAVPRPDARHEARAPRASRRRVLQRGRRPADRVAARRRGDVQVVDVRNDGTLAGLADADVVEVPARIDRDGAHPIPQAPLPSEMPSSSSGQGLRAAGDPGGRDRRSDDRPPRWRPTRWSVRDRRAGELLDAIFEANGRAAALLPGLMPSAARAAQPGPTWMRREIDEIPAVVGRLLSEAPDDLGGRGRGARRAPTLGDARRPRDVGQRRHPRPVPDRDRARDPVRSRRAVDHDDLRRPICAGAAAS